ncbi:MAG: GIY-YIG nuclease family protein [Lentimicrobiaceae bacterium]|jgi:putative endonuclease|nr:GIY-YIG nuclease family protein [Lentimicrobiaceae bacterium]
MSYFLYILLSEKNEKFYIGSSNDPERRLYEHNIGHTTSTKSGIPWKIIFLRKFSERSDAIREELRLKRMKNKK